MLWGFSQWSNIWACAGIRGEDKGVSRIWFQEEKSGAAKFSNFSPIHGMRQLDELTSESTEELLGRTRGSNQPMDWQKTASQLVS